MLFEYTWNKRYERYLVIFSRRKHSLVEMCIDLLLKEAGELCKEAQSFFAFVKEAGVPFIFCKEAADLSKEAEKKQNDSASFLLLFCFFRRCPHIS